MKKVILLDLNYTLVGNSEIKLTPFENQINQEVYRTDLIEKVRDSYVILITARPQKYEYRTITRIQFETGWCPNESFFNPFTTLHFRPPQVKQMIMNEHILHRFSLDRFFGIESNPKTREMYKKLNINSVPYIEFMEMQEW